MSRITIVVTALFCFLFVSSAVGQQAAADAPASKEDVEKYLETIHSKDTTRKMLDAMMPAMRQMNHEQILKNKDKLPPEFEDRMNRMCEDMLKDLPIDEMMQAMVPVYEKHFTKGDMESLTAFYDTPTGQKLLREMPAIMQESMQSMLPTMRAYMDKINERVLQEVQEAIKNAAPKKEQSGTLSN